MAPPLWRWLLSAGTLGALALGWRVYDLSIKPPPQPPVQQSIPRELAHVAQEARLSEAETLRLVIVPHPLGKWFDMRCLLYVNKEFGTSQLVCPNATQEQFEDREADRARGSR